MLESESLWGEEFELPQEKEKTKKVINKIKKPKEIKVTVEKQIKSKSLSLEERLKIITENVLKILGKQKENVIIIKTKEELHNYISKCIEIGRIDIDTETNNSLDPITCKLMGPCLYAPSLKQAYVPINHRNPETKVRLEWQLTEEDVKEELQRIIDAKTFTVTHNGKFDYEVIKMTAYGLEIPIDWDTIIMHHLIDDNSFTYNLKNLYIKLIDPEQEKYDIEHLFEGVEYSDVDPEIFALYAATDSMMTDKLYEYQKSILSEDDYKRVLQLGKEIEIPCVPVVAEMELNGVYLDKPYAKRLQSKYHKKLESLDGQIKEMLLGLKPQIDAWRISPEASANQKKKQSQKQYDRAKQGSGFDPEQWSYVNGEWYKVSKSKLEQLDENITPETLASPVQLGIILYDILKCPIVNKEKPYATGEDELKALVQYSPLCKLMLQRRELAKLLNAFIDSLPEQVNVDGKIHGHFNQYGAATGRFSSSDPNLQQIPSHNKEIRMLFKASPGCILVGSDYSQQEPRILAAFSKDENMINAYKHGKDLYATIAMGVYHNNYQDNLEFNPDGTPNPDGSKRRGNCKSLLLGIMYGRGVNSIAEQIHGTIQEAQAIVDNFYKSYPKVKKWIDESEEFAKAHGYVEDFWGRRRRLPDILLPKFTVRYKPGVTDPSLGDFNPFIGCKNRQTTNSLISQYTTLVNQAKSRKQIDEIKAKADKDGIEIINNGGFISAAQRQCVNARIQGSAATMTKMAMVKLHNDERLKELGFKLLIGVHDELIGECPVENVDQVAKLLTDDMKSVGEEATGIPFKCDADISYNWYWSSYKSVVLKEFLDYAKDHNNDYKEAFDYITKNHEELTSENLLDVVEGYTVA